MSPPPAVVHALEKPKMSDNYLLAKLLEGMGELLSDVGGIKERLNHGQKQMESMRSEHTALREMLAPVVTKVSAWDKHVEAAKETTRKFEAMEPEFRKMKIVTARFLTVAMAVGAIVSTALWCLTLIWPVVWGYIKTHISFNLGG